VRRFRVSAARWRKNSQERTIRIDKQSTRPRQHCHANGDFFHHSRIRSRNVAEMASNLTTSAFLEWVLLIATASRKSVDAVPPSLLFCENCRSG
jgi:hypothetical protein